MTADGTNQADGAQADPQVLSAARRWSGLYTVVLMSLLLIFFLYHQWKRTGFFTDKFGPAEMAALYLPIAISVAPPILRAIHGRLDPARLVEAASDLALAMGSIYLWNTFPFNFAHLGDIFPPAMHFAFAWLDNNVGRVILILQVVIGVLSGIATLMSYFSNRKQKT